MPRLLTVILNWRTPDMTLRAAEAALLAQQSGAGPASELGLALSQLARLLAG